MTAAEMPFGILAPERELVISVASFGAMLDAPAAGRRWKQAAVSSGSSQR
jgi:hypothetical protein